MTENRSPDHALLRGVPGEMEVDFGSGAEHAVDGDNGARQARIADALEWFFTGGMELLSHEGRAQCHPEPGQRRAGRDSVAVVTSGELGGKVVASRRARTGGIRASRAGRRFSCGGGRSPTSSTRPRPRSGRRRRAPGARGHRDRSADLQRAHPISRSRPRRPRRASRPRDARSAPVTPRSPKEECARSLQQICRGLGVDVPETSGQSPIPPDRRRRRGERRPCRSEAWRCCP